MAPRAIAAAQIPSCKRASTFSPLPQTWAFCWRPRHPSIPQTPCCRAGATKRACAQPVPSQSGSASTAARVESPSCEPPASPQLHVPVESYWIGIASKKPTTTGIDAIPPLIGGAALGATRISMGTRYTAQLRGGTDDRMGCMRLQPCCLAGAALPLASEAQSRCSSSVAQAAP